MSYKMKLVILTKSAKHGGFCVAGINLYKNKNWFARIVKNDDGDAVTDEDIAGAKPLDIIEVFVKGNKKKHNQTENFPIDFDANTPVKIVGRETVDYVKNLCDKQEFEHIGFFNNTKRSLTEEDVSRISYSLSAIKVKDLTIYKDLNNKFKADFTFNGDKMTTISMTDPDYYKGYDSVNIKNAILIVSLPSESFTKNNKDYGYYKFIAKIFEI